MNQADLNDIVSHPSESLNFEIKTWLDLHALEGIVKVAKACLALRNRGGGHLLIGFNDRSLKPDPYIFAEDCRKAFHPDCVQEIVSRYASDPFEVGTKFGLMNGQEYPIIEVPSGITVPVTAKRDLRDPTGQTIIAVCDIYFRSLNSNGRPSTAKAGPNDWKVILDICFENREADIGRFLRRHLGGHNKSSFLEAVRGLQPPTLRERAVAALESGFTMATDAFARRQESDRPPEGAGNWSVALVLDPHRPATLPTRDFFQSIVAANPQYTGWPIWLDSRGFSNDQSRPAVRNGAWEATISSSQGWSRHYDFMRLDPAGCFYLWRALQDDLTDKVAPQSALDPFIAMLRVSEALAVGLHMARAYSESTSLLGFAFRWQGLAGRRLESWANPLSPMIHDGASEEDTVETYTELPAETSLQALAPYLRAASEALFVAFDGLEFSDKIYEEFASRLVNRRFS